MELVLNPSFLSSKAGSQNKQNQWKCHPGRAVTKGWGLWARSREPGAGSREPGAGSREPGAGGQGFPPATIYEGEPQPRCFHKKQKENGTKRTSSHIAHTRQLEILVTTLVIHLKTAVSIARVNLHHLAHKHDTGEEDLLLISSTLLSRNYRFNTFTTINSFTWWLLLLLSFT